MSTDAAPPRRLSNDEALAAIGEAPAPRRLTNEEALASIGEEPSSFFANKAGDITGTDVASYADADLGGRAFPRRKGDLGDPRGPVTTPFGRAQEKNEFIAESKRLDDEWLARKSAERGFAPPRNTDQELAVRLGAVPLLGDVIRGTADPLQHAIEAQNRNPDMPWSERIDKSLEAGIHSGAMGTFAIAAPGTTAVFNEATKIPAVGQGLSAAEEFVGQPVEDLTGSKAARAAFDIVALGKAAEVAPPLARAASRSVAPVAAEVGAMRGVRAPAVSDLPPTAGRFGPAEPGPAKPLPPLPGRMGRDLARPAPVAAPTAPRVGKSRPVTPKEVPGGTGARLPAEDAPAPAASAKPAPEAVPAERPGGTPPAVAEPRVEAPAGGRPAEGPPAERQRAPAWDEREARVQQLQAEEGVPRKRAERIVDAELAEQAPPKPAVQQPPATLDSPAIPATLDAPSPVINLQRGGKVSHATATAPKQPVRLSNIIETLESVIERPVRTGRLGRPEEVQGFWRVKEEVVRARYPNDVAVTAHEIGHGLEKLGGVDLKGAPPAVVAELDALGKALYGNRQPNAGYPVEGWAEAVRKHVQGESVPPATEAFLTDVLARNPKMRDRLAAARQMAAEYEAQGPDGRFAAFQVSDRATIADSARKVRDVVANVTPGTSAFRERWVTGLEPIEAAERAAGTTTVSQSPRTATGPSAWAMHATKSAPMKAREFVQHGTLGNAVGKGLADILAPVVTPKRVWSLVDKERVQAWKDLTLAKRAKDYEARGLESGLRPDDVDAIIARHGNDPVLAKAATEAVAWRSRLFDDVLDAAGIDPVQRQAIRDANPNYAHLDRVFRADEGSSFEGPGRGLGGVGNPVKRRTGSTREVRDILETDIRDAERLIAVADKLRAQKALIEWAEANEGMGRFVEKIPKDKVPTKFTLEEIAKEVEQATGVPLDATSGALEATIWRAAKSPPGGENIVSLWRNGQQEWFQVEPRLYRTYMGLGPESALPTAQIASLLSKSPLGMASRGLRLGATGVNAGFSLLSNPFRDFFAAAVYGRRGSYLKGVAETLRPTEASRLYGAGGVEASTFAGVDRAAPAAIADRLLKGQAARGKVAMVLRHPVDSFRALSGALEGLPRKGEFRALLEAEGWKPGGPPPTPEQVMRASNAAADVTTNFRRAGEWGRVTNVVTAFQNPALQGLDKTVRTWRSDPVRTGARFSAYVGIPTLTLWWVNKDDPEYKTLPAWQRKGFWNAKIGERWYRVPKPPNLGVLANMLEDSADAALADGSFPTGLRQTLAEAWKTETPPVVPDAARITADVLRNEASFTGRPIVPKRLENVKPEEQYLEHTSETGKAVGKALGVSPAKVDYAAEQATGGLSRDIVGGAEKIAGLGKETAIYKKPPVVGRFMSTGAESDDFEKFWDLKKELEQGRASVGLHRREAFRGPAAPSAAPAQIAHLDGLGKRLTRLRRLVLEAPDGATRARARAEFAKAAAEARAKAESFLSRVAEKEPR